LITCAITFIAKRVWKHGGLLCAHCDCKKQIENQFNELHPQCLAPLSAMHIMCGAKLSVDMSLQARVVIV